MPLATPPSIGNVVDFDQMIRANVFEILELIWEHKGPPYEKWKNLKKFVQFFSQDVAWDLQKCILEDFLKNIYTILNASYFVVENFERPGPFFFHFSPNYQI